MESCQEEKNKELADFLNSIKKVNEPRKHKVNNSLGVYDAYKFLRKRKWDDIGRCLTEHEFYSIIRKVNDYLADSFLHGNDIKLPHRMGRIELRKYDVRVSLDGEKVKTNLPIDWNRTLKLWYEDNEAFKQRTLIKVENNDLFKILYNKNRAKFNNKCFYEFQVNRDIKQRLKKNIKLNRIDAFLCGKI